MQLSTEIDYKDSHTQGVNFKEFGFLWSIALVCTGVVWGWNSYFLGQPLAYINLLPSLITVLLWLGFCQSQFRNNYWRWFTFLIGLSLNFRFPLVVDRSLEMPLEVLSWLSFLYVIGVILNSLKNYFSNHQKLVIGVIGLALILFNSCTHLGLNSPFTYSFRLINHLASDFHPGQDNNQTWECSYEGTTIPVHCDMRHFIVEEKIFTEANYDASFSVFLRRFYYGYLDSLVGFGNHRWFASFTWNVLFWLLASVALHHTCLLFNLKESIADLAFLCAVSSWGMISFVGQPAPYLTAYALALIIPWSALVLVKNQISTGQAILLGTIFTIPFTIYDIYPVAVASGILFFLGQKYKLGLTLIGLQIAIPLIWTKIVLPYGLGTIGDVRNIQVISNSLHWWLEAIKSLSLPLVGLYLHRGITSFTIANFGIGAIGLVIFLGLLLLRPSLLPLWAGNENNIEGNSEQQSAKELGIFCGTLAGCTLLASIFLTPEAFFWSPNTGMLPRFNHYSFGVSIVALASLVVGITEKWRNLAVYWRFALPLGVFLIGCLDFTGIVSVPLAFDYGELSLTWK